MKYGKFLQSNKLLEFEQYYIDYKALKQICKECKFDPSGASFVNPSVSKQSPNALFIKELFAAAEQLSSDSNMLFGEAKARATALMTSIKDRSKEHFHLYKELEAFALHITQLDTFLHHNIEAIRKIVKKYDKKTKERNITWVARQSRPIHDVKSALSKFVVTISDMFLLLRQWEEGETDADTWTPPETFERKSTKYLVRMDQLLKVKLAIVKNLPLLVIGREEPTRETADPSNILKTDDHGLISSIYVDTEDLYTYHQRANREEGNQLIRFRWYNTYVPGDTVFCERKTHHESWVGESSLKERFPMPTNKVQAFTEGEWLPEDEKSLPLATQIQYGFKDKQYKPSVRTVYQRTAFQLASSNDLRISLDADLSFQNEKRDWQNFAEAEWHDNVSSEGLTNFQHFGWAVLEVKISAGATPDWVEELVQDETMIKDVPKFSKFLHSTALFHQNETGKLRVLPYWWDDAELADECVLAKHDGRDSQHIFTSMRASKSLENEKKGWFTFPTVTMPWSKKKTSSDSDTDSEKGKIPTFKGVQGKIEPKTYFANERTFIQWAALAVSFIVFAAVIGKIAVIYEEQQQWVYVVGLVMAIAGVVMLCFAMWQYFRRIQKIKNRDQEGYEDRCGPVFFAIIIFIVAGAAFVPSVLYLKDSHWSSPALVGVGVIAPVQWSNVFTAQPSDVIPLANSNQLMVPSLGGYYLVDKTNWTTEYQHVKNGMDTEAVTMIGDKAYFLSEKSPMGILEWDMKTKTQGRTFEMSADIGQDSREGEAMAYCPQCMHMVPQEFRDTHHPVWISAGGNKIRLRGIPKTGEGKMEKFTLINTDFTCYSEPVNGLHNSWKHFKTTKECKDSLRRPRAAFVTDTAEGPTLWLLIGSVMNPGRITESRQQFIVSVALDGSAIQKMNWRMFPVPATVGTYEGFSYEETSPGKYTAYLVDDNGKSLMTVPFDPVTGFHK